MLEGFAASDEAWGAALSLTAGNEEATEVRFYAANLLLRKVRSGWSRASDQARQSTKQAAQSLLTASEYVLVERGALVLAAAASKDGPNGFVSCLQWGLELAKAGHEIPAQAVLKAVADELDQAHGTTRSAFFKLLKDDSNLVQMLFSEGCASHPSTATAWIRLLAKGAARLAPSPAALMQMGPSGLYQRAAAHPNDSSCSELIAALFASDVSHSGGEPEEAKAAALALDGALHFSRQSEMEVESAANVCKACAAVLERRIMHLANGEEKERRALQQVLLGLSQRMASEEGAGSVLEAACDPILLLAGMPRQHRHPELCDPLFCEATNLLLTYAEVPEGLDEEDESFSSFREGVLCDLSASCFAAIRADFLARVSAKVEEGACRGSWRAVESGIFALRAIADDCIDVLGSGVPAEPVSAIFEKLAAADGACAHALVKLSACRALQAYMQWLSEHAPQHIICQFVDLASTAMAEVGSNKCGQAGSAIRSACFRAGNCIDPAWLCETVTSRLPGPSSDISHADGRVPAIEGVAHRISALSPSQQRVMVKQLASCLKARGASALASYNGGAGKEVALMARPMHLLAGEACVAYLAECWDTLSHAMSFPEAVDEACEGVAYAILGGGKAMLSHANQLLHEAAVPAVEAMGCASGCRALSAAAEAMGGECPGLPTAIARVAHAALAGNSINLTRAFLEAHQSCLLVAPECCLREEAGLAESARLASKAIAAEEREVARAAMALISTLVDPGRAALTKPTWQKGGWDLAVREVRANGKEAAFNCILALSQRGTSQLLPKAGTCLHRVATVAPEEFLHWLQEGLQTGFAGPGATAEVCQELLRLVAKGSHALGGPRRMEMLFADFGRICRGEAGLDAFVAYEL